MSSRQRETTARIASRESLVKTRVVSRRLRSSGGSILLFAPLLPCFWSDDSSLGVACRQQKCAPGCCCLISDSWVTANACDRLPRLLVKHIIVLYNQTLWWADGTISTHVHAHLEMDLTPWLSVIILSWRICRRIMETSYETYQSPIHSAPGWGRLTLCGISNSRSIYCININIHLKQGTIRQLSEVFDKCCDKLIIFEPFMWLEQTYHAWSCSWPM